MGSIVSHFTVWEKHTESSIWKIIGFTGTVNSTDINFKYDKHAGSLNEAVISSYIEMVSYVYRFWSILKLSQMLKNPSHSTH